MRKLALCFVTVGLVLTASAMPATPESVIYADDSTHYEVPTTEIVGGEKLVQVGKNIVFGVQPTSDPRPDGLHAASYAWVINPPVDDLFAWPDNTKACFGAGIFPARYRISLIATYVFVDADGRNPEIRTVQRDREIVVVGRVPDPGPGPQPGPEPEPEPGPALTELGQFVFDSVSSANMNKESAGMLAESYRSILARHAGANFVTPQQMGAETAESNRLVLGTQLKTWAPTLEKIANYANERKVGASVAQMVVAWAEIAAGLEAYHKAF